MTPEQWKQIQYFRRAEFACRHCQKEEMDAGFMTQLDTLRMRLGFPLIVSSGYRCPEQNAVVSDTGFDGPHTTGRAVDILISGMRAYDLLQVALLMNFPGIGIKQKGDMGARFIHLDNLVSDLRPRVWSY